MKNLYAANSMWNSAPADDRKWTLEDAYADSLAVQQNSTVIMAPFADLSVEAQGGNLRLFGPRKDASLQLSQYAMGQLCRTIGAPTEYLSQRSPELAAQCLNEGIRQNTNRSDRHLLVHCEALPLECPNQTAIKYDYTLRAATSESYGLEYNAEVLEAIMPLQNIGFRVPCARYMGEGEKRVATEADIMPGQINIQPGDAIGPAGVYLSPDKLFVFLADSSREISDGKGGNLMRGMFVENSEVGNGSLCFTFFLMQAVCGNHIVWGAEGVHEIRVRHVGKDTLSRAMRKLEVELVKYQNEGASQIEMQIERAQKLELGQTREEVIAAIVAYAKTAGLPILSKKRLDTAYETAELHYDWYKTSPRSLWGMIAGLTDASQRETHAVLRNEQDRAAGQLFGMLGKF